MKPDIARTIAELRKHVAGWRSEGRSIGMVPTMGALHAGHLALVRQTKATSDRVIVTLFVNPTQFGPGEDLAAYPRNEDADRAKLADLEVDLLFAPSASEMYADGFNTTVLVAGPSDGLESKFRPEHFAGVATIVAKLLLAGLPDCAFFGEKDFQQLLVVRKLCKDLNIPVEIVGCPTVREPDGLALSSRNVYLTTEERAVASTLYATIAKVAQWIGAGELAAAALTAGRRALESAGFAVDYIEARNAETLAPVSDWKSEPIRVLAAARLGRTRLIDNLPVPRLGA